VEEKLGPIMDAAADVVGECQADSRDLNAILDVWFDPNFCLDSSFADKFQVAMHTAFARRKAKKEAQTEWHSRAEVRPRPEPSNYVIPYISLGDLDFQVEHYAARARREAAKKECEK
jgi:hypothetical protein